MKTNEFYFQFEISAEQLQYANSLVDYSLKYHPITDIYKNDPGAMDRQNEFRLTGSLGEIVFADAYNLARPTKSYGAIDGQDYGQDFLLNMDGKNYAFDIKTMGRKNNIFRENYVLNLPAYQMKRDDVVTDFYFCISLHHDVFNKYMASFIGFVSKKEIMEDKIGILYKGGTKRIKDNGGYFTFQRDTYEIDFKDITTPFITDKIKKLSGFEMKTILPAFIKS